MFGIFNYSRDNNTSIKQAGVVHNIKSKIIKSVISLLCSRYHAHAVGIYHFLSSYCDVISCTTPACLCTFIHVQWFLLWLKIPIFLCTCLLTFCKAKLIVVAGELTHIPHQKKEMVLHAAAINYRMKSELSIMLRCQLCSTCYIALRIKNCLKRTSGIKVTTMKIQMISIRPSCATAKLTHFAVSKDDLDTKEDSGKSMKNALYILQNAKRPS